LTKDFTMLTNYCSLLLLLSALLPSLLFSQQKECISIVWSKHFGGTNKENANDIQQTADGGYIVAGFTQSLDGDVSNNFGSADYWVLKLDKDGDIEWEKSFGGFSFDIASSVVQAQDGGYVVTGGAVSSDGQVSGNHGLEDVWVIKLDATGNLLWSKTYGGTMNERAEKIRTTSDGGYILAGYSESNNGNLSANNGDFDYWLIKLNQNGDIEWQHSIGGSLADFGFDARETADGGYIMAGSTFSTDGDVSENEGFYDYWIVKVDATGNLLWEKNFGGGGEERAYSLVTMPDGSTVVAGASNSFSNDVPGNNGSYDYWVMKMDNLGNLVWTKNFGGSSEDRAFTLALTSSQELLVSGFAVSSNGDVSNIYGGKDAWLLKLDAEGNIIWEKNFGGSLEDRFTSIIQTSDGGYVGAGFSASNNFDLPGNKGLHDLWVLRLGPDSLKINLGADTSLCGGETLLLKVEEDTATYLWHDASTNIDFLVDGPGTFWVEVDKEGCKGSDTIVVDYIVDVPLELGSDTVLCQGETLLLETGIDDASYNWKNGSTAPSLPVEFPGVYWVEVNKENCIFYDTISVGFINVNFDLGDDAYICQGQSLLLDATVPGAEYRWQDASTEATFEVGETGLYWVRAGLGGCQKSDSVFVEVQLRPDTILADFSFICEGEGIWLDATQPGATYLWQNGATGPKLKAVEPGIYSVKLDINDCIFEDEIELRPCEECLYIPSAFTPNGDGINDLFQTFPGCEINNYRQLVFDRWGNLLFESNDPAQGWDGTFKSKKMDTGSFVFAIEYMYNNNGQAKRQTKRGIINLLR
jgi:gliding motility-associated-like protein